MLIFYYLPRTLNPVSRPGRSRFLCPQTILTFTRPQPPLARRSNAVHQHPEAAGNLTPTQSRLAVEASQHSPPSLDTLSLQAALQRPAQSPFAGAQLGTSTSALHPQGAPAPQFTAQIVTQSPVIVAQQPLGQGTTLVSATQAGPSASLFPRQPPSTSAQQSLGIGSQSAPVPLAPQSVGEGFPPNSHREAQ